jgi:4-hydroxy-2-oxoglutarate aldolase
MFSGIFPPLPTPFNEDGSLALDKLRSNVEKLNTTGLSGYVALGSNSEAVHVTPDEASQVFVTVKKAAAFNKIVIGGTGQFSTLATIEMTQRAADAGCAAALIITPFYYKNSMTADALKKHYFAIADRSPIPVLIYNVPANTSFNIAPSIVAEIAQHPNVVGIKDSAGDINQLAEYVRLTQSNPSPLRYEGASRGQGAKEFEVLSGNYGAMLPGLTFGIVGAILAIANIAPNECVSIFNLFKTGKLDEAGELHLRLLPVARAVTSQYGVPGLKAAMDMLGYAGGAPRSPLLPLGAESRSDVERMLRDANLLR